MKDEIAEHLNPKHPGTPAILSQFKTPADHAFIAGFVTGMYWLFSRGYVDTSDHMIEALREQRIFIEDLQEANVDAHVVQTMRDRGAPYRQE